MQSPESFNDCDLGNSNTAIKAQPQIDAMELLNEEDKSTETTDPTRVI